MALGHFARAISLFLVEEKLMRRSLLASAVLIALCGSALGNTGVFFGSGHSLQLIDTADVQMVAEDVLITPNYGASSWKHWAEFRCRFLLKNRSSKEVKIQVGFPLDRELQGPPPASVEDTEKVLSYHFIARDADQTYHVRYVGGDRQDKLAHIFLWDMSFAPNETKTLYVSYILPMSFLANTTNKEGLVAVFYGRSAVRPWQSRIEACITLYCTYVTETGKSWAGPIENARFRFVNRGFERDLRKLPEVIEDNSPEPSSQKDRSAESANDMGFVPGMKFGTVYLRILPEGSKPAARGDAPLGQTPSAENADGIGWEFENYKPGEPLVFVYYLLNFPQTPAECDPWVRQVLGKEPAKADILELREVLAAFFGVPPQTGPVRRIVEKEVWYSAKSKLTESQLSETQRAILSRLSRIADTQSK
jgi:hypothetical protein